MLAGWWGIRWMSTETYVPSRPADPARIVARFVSKDGKVTKDLTAAQVKAMVRLEDGLFRDPVSNVEGHVNRLTSDAAVVP